MREIDCSLITENVKKLCIEANYNLPEDVESKICSCLKEETYCFYRNWTRCTYSKW